MIFQPLDPCQKKNPPNQVTRRKQKSKDTTEHDMQDQGAVRVYSRRKIGAPSQQVPRGRHPLEFNLNIVTSMFNMPQGLAARKLDVSVTTMKQICRRLGIERWPYTRKGRRFVRKSIGKHESESSGSSENDSAKVPVTHVLECSSRLPESEYTCTGPTYAVHTSWFHPLYSSGSFISSDSGSSSPSCAKGSSCEGSSCALRFTQPPQPSPLSTCTRPLISRDISYATASCSTSSMFRQRVMQEHSGTTPTPAKAEHECRAYIPQLAGKVALSSSQADQDWEDYDGNDLSFLLSFQCANDAWCVQASDSFAILQL